MTSGAAIPIPVEPALRQESGQRACGLSALRRAYVRFDRRKHAANGCLALHDPLEVVGIAVHLDPPGAESGAQSDQDIRRLVYRASLTHRRADPIPARAVGSRSRSHQPKAPFRVDKACRPGAFFALNGRSRPPRKPCCVKPHAHIPQGSEALAALDRTEVRPQQREGRAGICAARSPAIDAVNITRTDPPDGHGTLEADQHLRRSIGAGLRNAHHEPAIPRSRSLRSCERAPFAVKEARGPRTFDGIHTAG